MEEPELNDTVFIRNLARFDTTQESLKEFIEKNFGPTVYCLICKDKETGDSKGTAFVKFKSAETARECLEEYEDPDQQTKFFLDGRNLFFLPALSRDKINEVKLAKAPSIETEADDGKKKKKKARHNRVAKSSIPEQVSANSDKLAPQKARPSQHNKPQKATVKTNDRDKNKMSPRESKKKSTKQFAKKLSKNAVNPKPLDAKVAMKMKKKKKGEKKSFKQQTGEKQRGRH